MIHSIIFFIFPPWCCLINRLNKRGCGLALVGPCSIHCPLDQRSYSGYDVKTPTEKSGYSYLCKHVEYSTTILVSGCCILFCAGACSVYCLGWQQFRNVRKVRPLWFMASSAPLNTDVTVLLLKDKSQSLLRSRSEMLLSHRHVCFSGTSLRRGRMGCQSETGVKTPSSG